MSHICHIDMFDREFVSMSTALHIHVHTRTHTHTTFQLACVRDFQPFTPRDPGVKVQDQKANELTLQEREKSSRPDICLFKEWW